LVSEAEWAAWQKCKEDTHAASITAATNKELSARRHRCDRKFIRRHFHWRHLLQIPGRVGDSLSSAAVLRPTPKPVVSPAPATAKHHEVVLAKTAVDLLRQRAICVDSPAASSSDASTADLAAREAVHLFASAPRTGGLILLDRHANPGFAFNTPRMAYGYVAPDATFITAV